MVVDVVGNVEREGEVDKEDSDDADIDGVDIDEASLDGMVAVYGLFLCENKSTPADSNMLSISTRKSWLLSLPENYVYLPKFTTEINNPIDYNARLKVFLFVLVLDFASVVVEIAKQIQ